MKIAKLELAYALKKLGTANGKNNLVSIEVAGQVAAITAYDGEALQMQMQLKCEASEEENGKKYVVQYNKFFEVVSIWKADSIKITENGGLVMLSEGKTEVAIPFKTEMPELKLDGLAPACTPVVFKQDECIKGLKELMPLVNDKYPGFYLEPVANPVPDEEKPFGEETAAPALPTLTRVWATDGSRTHYFELKGAFSSELYLPKVAGKLIACLKGEMMLVPMGEKYLVIKDSENTVCVVSLVAKKIPVATLAKLLANYAEDSCADMELNTVELTNALNLICAVTTDEQKKFSFTFNKGTSICVSLSDTTGKGTTEVAGKINCTADMYAPVFNAEQLALMCQSAGTEKVNLVLGKTMMFLVAGGVATYAICGYNKATK